MPIGKSKIEDIPPDREGSIHVWESRDSSGTGISKITVRFLTTVIIYKWGQYKYIFGHV